MLIVSWHCGQKTGKLFNYFLRNKVIQMPKNFTFVSVEKRKSYGDAERQVLSITTVAVGVS